MRVIIAGGRDIPFFTAVKHVFAAVNASRFIISEVISGKARGVDHAGEFFACWFGIPCRLFPADWERYGTKAGSIRNGEMARNGDALIAIWDGKSRGTGNMIKQAREHGLQVYIHQVMQ